MRWVTDATRKISGMMGRSAVPARRAAQGIAEDALVGDGDPAQDVGVPRIRAAIAGGEQHVRFDRGDEATEALRLVHGDRAGEAGVLP